MFPTHSGPSEGGQGALLQDREGSRTGQAGVGVVLRTLGRIQRKTTRRTLVQSQVILNPKPDFQSLRSAEKREEIPAPDGRIGSKFQVSFRS